MRDIDIKVGMTVIATKSFPDLEKGKKYKVMKNYLPEIWELRELGLKGWLSYQLGLKSIIVFNNYFKPTKNNTANN